MSGLRKFTTKHNTPRIVQIFYTIICVAVVLLVWQGELRDYMNTAFGGNSSKCGSILFVFYYIFGCQNWGFFQYTIDYIFIGIGIIGIMFVWMNRPKLAAITPGVYLVTMLLTLLKKDFTEYYLDGEYFVSISFGNEYTYAWIAVVVFVILAVITILVTKKGERKPVAVRVTEMPKPVVANGGLEQKVSDLAKYKELLDSGVITQEEFDAKKKQLLEL